ncbi:RWD-domain-containing protein [Xylariaceae sp. FL1272]|nr:RWD-domain-containing protein [Xylariaceae sp. FL1272]
MDDDIRDVELETLAAIYPELQIDEDNPHKFSIELPVSLVKPLNVLFPAATETAPAVSAEASVPAIPEVDSQSLQHLPALQVNISLPRGYPEQLPPLVIISTSPPWLSPDILRKLEADAIKLWDEMGHDQVIFTYIDDLRHSAEDVFGLVSSQGNLEVEPEHKIALLDYDINAKRKAFEKETFDCGICLDPKKGVVCHKMLDCGHVFCVPCLQDFYNQAITQGDVTSIVCLEPNCAKEREKAAAGEGTPKKVKTFISPSELLQIPIEPETVKRYVMLKHKIKLESDKNTIYCPRSWCQGAARSKKHKKPQDFEIAESDDEEEEDTGLLAICEDCGFAFCSRCEQSWHGEFKYCRGKVRDGEMTEEERATLEYLKYHTSPCPTCAAPVQKTHGCNHMICGRCQTHFCYLCSSWLDPSNPYRHYNTQPGGKVTSCYMRLWELEGGDGDDVGADYEGGDALRNRNEAAGQYGEHLEIAQGPRPAREGEEEPQNQERQPLEPRPEPAQAQLQQQDQQEQREARPAVVAREGPLVLRIDGGVPVVRPPAVAEPQPQPRGNAGHRGGRGNRRGRGAAGAHQQHDRNQNQNQGQANRRPPYNAMGRPIRGGRNAQANPGPVPLHHLRARGNADQNADQLDPVQEAWIRQFVQLALNDEEDEWDSDEE